MLSADEIGELRVLQGRAYGRDGALTEVEAQRLRELAEKARAVPEPVGVPTDQDPSTAVSVDATAPASDAHESPSVPQPSGSPAPETDTVDPAVDPAGDALTAPPRRGLGGILRTHVKTVVAAAAVLLLVGLAAGWALFGRQDDGVALTAAQQERRIELQSSGDFDEGSVRIIGQDDDATVWYGTKQDGELACIVLEVGENSTDMCQPEDELEASGYNAGVSLVDGEGDSGTQISANAVRAVSGEIVAIIQRWPSGGDAWLSQFTGSERTRAEQLLDLGFEEYSFSVVGYVNDLPVWRAARIEDGMSQDCLVVDALAAMQCADSWRVQSGDVGIGISGAEVDESGASTGSWSIDLGLTSSGNSYLMIRGDVPATVSSSPGSSPGSFIELGGEHGDPILVEVPSDESAD